MIGKLIKATKLEINHIKENKFSMLFFLLVPSIIISIFGGVAKKPITWGAYGSLGITGYDLYSPGILPLIILFITTQLTVLRIVGERAPFGTLDRDLLAIPKVSMYFGKLLTNFLFFIIQLLLIYIIITRIFPVNNFGGPIVIILFLLLIGLFGLALGLAISIFSKSKEQAVQLVPLFILLLFIFGGLIFNIELSPVIQIISDNSPLMLTADSLRMSMLDGVGFEDVTSNLYKLIYWNIGLIFISMLKFKFERKK